MKSQDTPVAWHTVKPPKNPIARKTSRPWHEIPPWEKPSTDRQTGERSVYDSVGLTALRAYDHDLIRSRLAELTELEWEIATLVGHKRTAIGVEQTFRWVLGEKLHSPVTGRLYVADDMCEQVRQEFFDIRPLVEEDPNCDKLTLGSYRALGWLLEVSLVDPIDWR